MSTRVHFKLAYSGVTHKFASALRDEDLFKAVTGHISKIVKKNNFELYWKDDDSNVVLEVTEDLLTAISYAQLTKKRASDIPCVQLTVDQFDTEGFAAPAAEAVDEHVAVCRTPMPEKVHFEVAFNGGTHRFSSTECEDSLYHAVVDRVNSLLGEGSYELFLKDEWSTEVVDSATKFNALVELAKIEKKNTSDCLWIHLVAGEIPVAKCNDDAADQLHEEDAVAADGVEAVVKSQSTSDETSAEECDEDAAQPQQPCVDSEKQTQDTANKKNDFAAREREIAIREKALQLKEEVFERYAAVWEMNMAEYEEKFESLKMRAVDIEENPKILKSKMDDLKERLEKVEEKADKIDD